MNEFKLNPIGIVQNEFNAPTDNLLIKAKESTITVYDEFSEGLLTIESMEYIDIVFIFNQSEEDPLIGTTKSGRKRGVFASRLPKRPNSIGVTTAKLLKRERNKLTVIGLDALNKSPVIDIKSGDTSMFGSEEDENLRHNAILKSDPRKEIKNNIAKGQTDVLLMKAAQMHGHYCPGLAMGVMAAVYAMNQLKADSDGMEDLLAICETNNCFADGVQFVSGCSFGNNALIFKDLGKTAFTLSGRNGEGIRVSTKAEAREAIKKAFPDHQNLYQKVVAEKDHNPELLSEYKRSSRERAFGTLKIPIEDLFSSEAVNIKIPDYAPSFDSLVCENCGEPVMETRIVDQDGKFVCYTCSDFRVPKLDGNGIHVYHFKK